MDDELKAYLEDVKSKLGDRSISYVSRGKEKYQIEIPIETCSRHSLRNELRAMFVLSSYLGDFQLVSQTKKVKRFWSDKCKEVTFTFRHRRAHCWQLASEREAADSNRTEVGWHIERDRCLSSASSRYHAEDVCQVCVTQ